MMEKPFITWADLTVAQYLCAVILLGGVVAVLFVLLAAICGMLVRNAYLGPLIWGTICFGLYTAPAICSSLGLWMVYFLLCCSPVGLWTGMEVWFTESGIRSLIPWQESIAAVAGLILLGTGVGLALRRWNRKDVIG